MSAALMASSKDEAIKKSGEINTIVTEMLIEFSPDGEAA